MGVAMRNRVDSGWKGALAGKRAGRLGPGKKGFHVQPSLEELHLMGQVGRCVRDTRCSNHGCIAGAAGPQRQAGTCSESVAQGRLCLSCKAVVCAPHACCCGVGCS